MATTRHERPDATIRVSRANWRLVHGETIPAGERTWTFHLIAPGLNRTTILARGTYDAALEHAIEIARECGYSKINVGAF
jgi:hypothetical protein